MPTTTTKTVKSSGGDYSSLSGYEAGEQGDLPTLDEIRQAECYSFEDTTQAIFDGWTTDATRYIRIYTPAAERHDGKWNTAKYRLASTDTFQRALSLREEFVRVEGLQIHANMASDYRGALDIAPTAASDVRIEACIIRGPNGGSNDEFGGVFHQGHTALLRNCVIYMGAVTAPGIWSTFSVAAPVLTVENCTVIGTTFGIARSDGTPVVKNCYCHGGTDAYSSDANFTRTTCAHSSATVYTGSTASIAHSTANFTNVTAGSEDYHLVSGASSTLKTGGDDLSGSFTVDIDGQTRVDWGIGADEFIAGGGAAVEYVPGRRLVGWFATA